jgi:acetaldehyde dehydrogenase/alcohol dehydrogenase
MMADAIGLAGETVDEKVRNLIAAVESLLDQLAIPKSIADLGISMDEFERAIPELTQHAFEDPSWRTNPRMPLVTELTELFRAAYKGRSVAREVSEPCLAV